MHRNTMHWIAMHWLPMHCEPTQSKNYVFLTEIGWWGHHTQLFSNFRYSHNLNNKFYNNLNFEIIN